MPTADPDELTLRRARSRDARACRELVTSHQTLVFTVVSRVLGRASPDVADAAQESFAKMFASLDRWDPQGPARFSTWLATVATRVAIDHARRRRATVPLDEALDAPSRHDGPDVALDVAQRRRRLAAAMESLSPEQRAAMTLRAEHGLSYEAIAEALGVEVGTVRSRLSRAKTTLTEALRDAPEETAP